MKRAVLFVFLISICMFAWQPTVAQTVKTAIPPAATAVLTQMEKEVIQAKRKAIESLDRILKETTKKGDLTSALAIKEELDRLRAEVASPASGNGAAILGRWTTMGCTIEFSPDGTVSLSDGTTGTWTARGTAIEAAFTNGITHHMERTADGYAGVYKRKGAAGGALQYRR